MALVNPLSERVQTLWNSAQAQAWGPLVSLSRTAVLSLFQSIEFGRLAVYDGDSEEALAICGNPKAQAGYRGTSTRSQ